MDKETPVRIGVMGTADIARRHIIPALESLPGQYRISGIATRDAEKAGRDEIFGKYPVFQGYGSLLSKETTDVVYIPLPNSLHAEWIDRALDAGIHVLVEKSLACSLAEAEYLNNKARDKGLVLVENFQFRFHRQWKEITRLLEEGAIGELRCMRSSFGFPPFTDKQNIRYQKALGGGALLDAGAYPIKLAQMILGRDISVGDARLYTDKRYEVDTWGGAFIRQNAGSLFAEIAFGFDHFYQCSLELWGSRGKLTAGRIFTAPPGFEPGIELETSEGKQTISPGADNHFRNMLIHVHTLVNDSFQAKDEYEQNINQARLLEECKRLAHAG